MERWSHHRRCARADGRCSIFIIAGLLIATMTQGIAQTLTASDGELDRVLPARTYTLQPIPPSDTSVTSVIPWYDVQWGAPMIFTITAAPGTAFRVDFTLDGTTDTSGGQPAWFFPDDALRWEERDMRMDPKVSQTIIADSTGTATLYLGISVVLPARLPFLMYGATVRCRAVDVSGGDSLTAEAFVGAYPQWVDYFPTSIDGEMKNLSRNQTYALVAGTSSNPIVPVINGRETGSVGKIWIDANPGSEVLVSTVLPSSFSSDDDGPLSLPCTYTDSSYYLEETGEYLNRVPGGFVLTVGARGRATVDVGLVITVPAGVAPGSSFTGQMIFSATYTGNAKSTPRKPRQSEMEVLITVNVLDQEIPQQFSLSQNYPNPFNSGTTIPYGLPHDINVELKIFDLLGREIVTVVDGFRSAGDNAERFDPGNLPSGVYYYRIRAEGFTDVKKMIIAR